MIRVVQLVLLSIAVGVLAACSTGSGFSDLDREPIADDVLPAYLPTYATEDVDAESVRFAGGHDGFDFYLMRRAEGGGVCIAVLRPATEEWVTGCGGGNGTVGVSALGVSVLVAPDGSPELDDGIQVGANIVVR